MGSEVDRVWATIKTHARTLAKSGRRISYRDARHFVSSLWERECLEPPRDETLDFFASELVSHVPEYQQTMPANS